MNSNVNKLIHYLHKKCDASSLAFTRIIIGVLLLIDIVYERGLSRADLIWGNPNECRFPLFDGLVKLPLRGMCAVYTIMVLGNIGIILGLKYRLSCFIYLICYWYIFLLDKSRWNNHSYLFGLLVLLLSVSNANFEWSLDYNLFDKSLEMRTVPFWQYFLMRSQIFFVYFIAGLKKIDADWLKGYSMTYLSDHWAFGIFRIIFTNEQIDFYIVHWGGFLFDLTIGFFLICKKSRYFAYIFCLVFNLINSQLFSIGMFPYMMIAIIPLFSSPDWPKLLFKKFNIFKKLKKDKDINQDNDTIVDQKLHKSSNKKKQKILEKPTIKQKLTLVLISIYLIVQIFLPHSHWLTKGYNTWTNGLYGYSWDMMVHNWKHIHTRVTVIDSSMRKFYLDPEAWTKSSRWSHHSDMVKQFAVCAQKRLYNDFNITNPSIYVDAWISLNGRFAQRVYDPRVDIVRAEWTPFQKPDWVLPLLTQLTDWRLKLKQVEQSIYEESNYTSVIFIADFPGMSLSNFINSDFENTTLTVLTGWLKLEINGISTRIMSSGDRIIIPSNRFHKISTIKSEPACYMFIYVNTTHRMLTNQPKYSHWSQTSQSNLNKFKTLTTKNRSNSKLLKPEVKNPWFISFKFMCEGMVAIIELLDEMVLTLYQLLFIS